MTRSSACRSAERRPRWARAASITAACVLTALAASAQTPAGSPAAPAPGSPAPAPSGFPTLPAEGSPAPSPAADPTLPEVVVAAPEPRYVAPTNRDRIGRVWAPVYINEQGPFRLVLDTGATASAILPSVVERLGLAIDPKRTARLTGVTGSKEVQMVRADSFRVGDLEIEPAWLPVVEDVFGGAEGVLGHRGLHDKRIEIDFRRDRISIRRSKGERAAAGLYAIPAELTRGLLVIPARVGNVRVRAVLDTGAQVTLGNEALRIALERARLREAREEKILGVTLDEATATSLRTPPISLGDILVRNARITFGDVYIFRHWRMTNEPALLLGMDVIGVLDRLVIDYRRRELHVRL